MGRSWWRVLTTCGLLEKGMANHLSILALREPWTVWKGKMTGYWKRNSVGQCVPQYATGDQWRNNSRKNEEMEPKQKQRLGVDVTGDGSKVWRCTDQYYIGSWNVRSMNKSKLEVVKQEMARVKPTLGDLFKERTFLGMSLFRMGGWYTNFFFIKRRTVVEAVVGIDSRHDGVHGRCILTSVWGNSVYGSQRSP